MSEYRDPCEAFVDTLRAEMPPTAGEDARSRVRARVLASRHTRKSPALRRSWRVAGSLATAVAVVAVAAILLAPRMETSAFARERAVAALMFQSPGRVLHLELTYTQKNQSTDGEVLIDTKERWSVWVDAEQVPQADGSTEFSVFWPVDQRFATVRIHYRTHETPLGVIQRLSARRFSAARS